MRRSITAALILFSCEPPSVDDEDCSRHISGGNHALRDDPNMCAGKRIVVAATAGKLWEKYHILGREV